MPVLLSVERLTLARGGRPLVCDLSFSVSAGQALVVTGPNGAGKSTLLRALAGLLRPVSGRISVTGPRNRPGGPRRPPRPLRRPCGRPQERPDGAREPRLLGRGPRRTRRLRRARALLLRPSWSASDCRRSPTSQPDGSRRARSAAWRWRRLLMVHRPIWILDEPATALDRAAQQRLAGAMADHRRDGGLISRRHPRAARA